MWMQLSEQLVGSAVFLFRVLLFLCVFLGEEPEHLAVYTWSLHDPSKMVGHDPK